MAQYEGFVTNWNGEKEYVSSETWYSEIRENLTLKQFKNDLRGNGYKCADCYIVSTEKMDLANKIAEFYEVDIKVVLRYFKEYNDAYNDFFKKDTAAEAEENASIQEQAAAETTENNKELIEKAAKENAKDCLYYGFGRKYWNSLKLDKETADKIWQQAIKELESN